VNQLHLGISLRSAEQKRSQTLHCRPLLTARSDRPSGYRAPEQDNELAPF
jgi:hypothetical protein